MIVYNFNLVSIRAGPAKADPPLVVYPNAVLSLAIPFQEFQLVAWRHRHLPNFGGGVQGQQLSPGVALDRRWKTTRHLRSEQSLCLHTPKAYDHTSYNNVPRYYRQARI